MANILDYIDWRGDLDFNNSPFNEIDSLILSRVSYLPFELIINNSDTFTLKDAYSKFSNIKNLEKKVIWQSDINLIEKISNSKRFQDLKISDFINILDIEKEKQFSAITIFLPDDTLYISFRGTDNTLTGWKEDFNMGFTPHVPSQISSVKYLETISSKYLNKIRLGGHSKGGNLAIYSAIYVSPEIQSRIINIDNHDGPGFNEEIVESKEYLNILNKIHTFVPQSSVVGMLLNHGSPYNVVQSTAKGLMQHDAYSWQLLGTNFIKMKEITNSSKIIDKTLKDWTKDTTPEQREEILNILFELLSSTNSDDVNDLLKNWYRSSMDIIKSYKNISPENKELLSKTITSLTNIAKNNLFNN